MVLDPFFGTGTTGAVAKMLGRDFIGIEREAAYRAVAEKRIGRIRRLDADALATTRAKRSEPRIPFGQVIERGMLRPGEEIYSMNNRHKAKVRADGSLIGNDVKGSIHQVGAALEGAPSCNGWTYWHYRREGRMIPIDILRQQIRAEMEGELAGGYYVQPTIFRGDNSMRIFQEEIFGPVVSTTTFTDFDDAMRIANDTLYGLGAGVWSRNGNTAYRAGRAIQAGRVWVNNYHAYPAHAAFGGYKSSGIGRENHLMMLDHYQQTKNLLVSYSEDKLGFF